MNDSNVSNVPVEPGKRTRFPKLLSFGQDRPEKRLRTTATEIRQDEADSNVEPDIPLTKEAKRYTEAVEKLNNIMSRAKGIDQFPKDALKVPQTVADVETVAKSMSSAIADFAENREKLKKNRSQLRGMVETLYKASFAFIQGSLDIVSV